MIVVLGAPNNSRGELGAVAVARVEEAVRVYLERPGVVVLPTGGFGPHFNTSALPHYAHLTRELVARGVDSSAILDGVPSTHTGEDAVGSCERARVLGIDEITVVTSDFHGERAELLFGRVCGEISVAFRLADSSGLAPELLADLRAHEKAALTRLRA